MTDGGEGEIWKVARHGGPATAVQRSAPLSPEAAWKNLQQERATERTLSEKEIATEDGKGAAGDLTGYLPTGEERQTHEDYRDWVHSNNGDQISGGISNNNDL